MQTAAEKPT